MAEEEEKDSTQDDSPKAKSSNLILIVIISVLVLILIIGGAIAVLLLSSDDEQMIENSAPKERSARRDEVQRSTTSLTIGPMYPLDNFIVNLLSESGRRFLKTQINLELSGEELAMELEQKTAVIRDVVIRVLTSKTLEEVSTSKGKEKLKDQIVNQINLRLRDGEVQNVYFTEFVVQ